MNHAVPGIGDLNLLLDLTLLPVVVIAFLVLAARMHRRSRVLGY